MQARDRGGVRGWGRGGGKHEAKKGWMGRERWRKEGMLKYTETS